MVVVGGLAGATAGRWLGEKMASKIDNWFAGLPEMAVEAAYRELNLPMDESNDKLIKMYEDLKTVKLRGNDEGVRQLDTAMAIIAVHRALPDGQCKPGQKAVEKAYKKLNVNEDVDETTLLQMYKAMREVLLLGEQQEVEELDAAMQLISTDRGIPDQRWKNKGKDSTEEINVEVKSIAETNNPVAKLV